MFFFSFYSQVSLADINFVGLQQFIKADLEQYPDLKALYERVRNIENIKKYMDTQ